MRAENPQTLPMQGAATNVVGIAEIERPLASQHTEEAVNIAHAAAGVGLVASDTQARDHHSAPSSSLGATEAEPQEHTDQQNGGVPPPGNTRESDITGNTTRGQLTLSAT